VTASEIELGVIFLRSMTMTNPDVKRIEIPKSRIIDINFCSNSSKELVILTENQILIWLKFNDDLNSTKILETSVSDKPKYTHAKLNWFDKNQVVCFNQNEILVLNKGQPARLLNVKLEGGFRDIYFIPNVIDSIFTEI